MNHYSLFNDFVHRDIRFTQLVLSCDVQYDVKKKKVFKELSIFVVGTMKLGSKSLGRKAFWLLASQNCYISN